MDLLFTQRRLSAVLAVFVLLLCGAFYSPSASATTYSEAMALCQAKLPAYANSGYPYGCVNRYPYGSGGRIELKRTDAGIHDPVYFADYSPSDDMCTSRPVVEGKIVADNIDTTDGCDGTCRYVLTDGLQVATKLGGSITTGTWTPVGLCASASAGWGNGVPATSTAPSVCSGGSCYDANANKYCAVDSAGNQACVAGAAANTPAGGCGSGGSATVCAGAAASSAPPAPPLPPAPPASPISDPATEIHSTDNYTTTTTTGGSASTAPTTTAGTTTVNVYGQGGSTTGSGQKPGDSGPAPPSSTSPPPDSDPGSYAGGQSCTSPPVCSGDPVMCGVGKQSWQAMCQAKASADLLHSDSAGDGKGPPGDEPMHTSADVWSDTTGTLDPIANAANAGNYDMSGMGFSTTCPLTDMDVPMPFGQHFSIKFSAGCELGGWLRAIIIAFALFAAAKITAGGNG
jgi:hypothetical protein